MAVDKDKLEEDASIARFYKIDSKDGFVMEKVKDTYKDVDDYISKKPKLRLFKINETPRKGVLWSALKLICFISLSIKPRLRLLNMKSLVTSSSERDRFFYTCKVPNKDFDSFFSDENMKSFAVKEESSSTEAVRNDDVDNYAPSDNLWDVDQAQEDDNDFGVGDMDMDMDNASCSDD
ncbi:unnamed protein product [Prunus armeniaca]